jgi:hypothetical protein
MVKELIEQGYEGPKLVAEVMKLTGLPAPQAEQLIAIETGKSNGDVVSDS